MNKEMWEMNMLKADNRTPGREFKCDLLGKPRDNGKSESV